MTSLRQTAEHLTLTSDAALDAVAIYHTLLRDQNGVEPAVMQQFIGSQLQAANKLPSDLPEDVEQLEPWVANNAHEVAERYRAYLEERHAGGPRKFFTNKAHALYFLRHVAPSKLVDGAWLYGTVKHASDWRYQGLIRTYLEELGDGVPALNHVVLFRKLLAEHDCAPSEQLDETRYLQGAIQLALGQMCDEFLPEMLGYNLGYEQLPLHLLITAFELNELVIDPYYFTLHVTIDNASSGHAYKAVRAVLDLLPADDTRAQFLERLRAGYLLNDLGENSIDLIGSFDLEEQLLAVLENKRSFGQHMHSDYCRLEGRTVNEWLSKPGQSRQFLTALENKGWIKRHQDPTESRFWQLVDGPGAVMFGVFSGYEMQVLKDWIAGDWQAEGKAQSANPFRSRFRRRATATVSTVQDAMPQSSLDELIARLSPASHSTPEGLAATRSYVKQLAKGCLTQ